MWILLLVFAAFFVAVALVAFSDPPWAPVGGNGRGSLSKSGNPLEAEAKRHNVTAVQLALAWLLQKSPVMLPIPGTANIAHLEANMVAANLQLTSDDSKRIEELVRNG